MPALHLTHFSSLAQASADRNLTALGELQDWLEAICDDRLGPPNDRSERQAKAAGWVKTVARKTLMRSGHTRPLREDEAQSLASAEPWIEKALAEGRAPQRLLLDADEKSAIVEILDWLRAPTGPALSGDWSRISFKQAEQGHQDWIQATQKRAEREAEATAAFDGCERIIEVKDQPELEGWSWVRVISPEALNREGALMRHCVGSYAEEVAEGRASIWSLRDPEGKPSITVETADIKFAPVAIEPAREAPEARSILGRLSRLRQDGAAAPDPDEAPSGTPIERRLQQIRGFANATIGSKDIGAVEELLLHFQRSGAPVTEGGPDLPRAGRALTPAGFGEMKIWRRGETNDEAEAIRRIEALEWSSRDPDDLKAPLLAAGLLFETMKYKAAFKALGPLLSEDRLKNRFSEFAILAESLELALGVGRLSGRVLDPHDPADQTLCSELAAAPMSVDLKQAAGEAELLARLGRINDLSAFVAQGVAQFGSPFSAAVNERLIESMVNVRIGAGAFSDPAIWEKTPDHAALAEAISLKVTAAPPSDDNQINSRADALALCADLGYHRAAEILFESISNHREIIHSRAGRAIKEAGYAKPQQLSFMANRLWTPSEQSGKAAVELLKEGLSISDCEQSILAFSSLGHHEAVAKATSLMLNQQSLERTLGTLSKCRAELPADIINQVKDTRSDLEDLLLMCMEGGLNQSARTALTRLKALPVSEFESEEEAQNMTRSFDAQLKTIDLIQECVTELQQRPRLAFQFQHSTIANFDRTMETSTAFSSFRDHLGLLRDSSVYRGVSSMTATLSTKLPVRFLTPVGASYETSADTREKLASFLNNGPINFDIGQRDALISAITDFGKMNAKGPFGTRVAPKSRSSSRQAPGLNN